MPHQLRPDEDCAIAQALSVVGDWWSLLIVRDVAGGTCRFDALQAELDVSRKVLTQRLKALVADGVLVRCQYSDRPARFEYRLTAKGRALLPVMVALQQWGGRYVMGDGTLTATAEADSPEAGRVQRLVGRPVPPLQLPGVDLLLRDVVDPDARWTVLYCFPGAYADQADYPPEWQSVPGAAGCTFETLAFRERVPDFAQVDAAVVGVSTQRPDHLRRLREQHDLPFPLLSDENLQLAATLRLPTFRAAGDRLKRLTLVIDSARTIRGVLYPISRPAESVDDALSLVRKLTAGDNPAAALAVAAS